jgi:hypothetical protein
VLDLLSDRVKESGSPTRIKGGTCDSSWERPGEV